MDNKEEIKQGSSGEVEPIAEGETPQASKPSFEKEAYDLAKKNEKKIEELENQINKPTWVKSFIKSASIIQYFSVSICFVLIVACIIFLILVYVEAQRLLDIFERISDSKSLNINETLLQEFNQLFQFTKSRINTMLYIIGAIALLGFVAAIVNLFRKKN